MSTPAREPLTPYQRFVVLAAWMGLGFDLMDSLLFNFVAPICVPQLLHLVPGTPETKAETGFWTGVLTSVMLLAWAIGGVLFGKISDRIGRTRTVVITMLLFSLGTLACALAPSMWLFVVFRFLTALGIGGEWGAGATLVAETVPESRRVEMGALLFTSAPVGVFIAIAANYLFTSQIESIASNPSLSWRAVMACGAVPAVIAVAVRSKLKEPERWTKTEDRPRGRILELFSPSLVRRTLGGLTVTTTALLTFWVSSAFLPVIAAFLADDVVPKPAPADLPALRASLVTRVMMAFNIGGLIGSLLAAPIALRAGRRPLFLWVFGWSAAGLVLAFGPAWSPGVRLLLMGVFSISTYGVFGAFQFYLPELFPSHVRGTGLGFCLNVGRFLTVPGPFLVGFIVKRGVPVLDVMRYLAIVPAAGFVLLLLGLGVETRGQKLAE
jgi:MFS family permease